MIETTLRDLLLTESSITDIVGSRIYPLLADETVVDSYIVFQVISAPREHTFDGAIGLVKARVQLTCWTDNYYNSIALKEAVREFIDGYSDTDNPSIGDPIIYAIYFEDEGDIIDFSSNVDKSKHYGKRIDISVFYSE